MACIEKAHMTSCQATWYRPSEHACSTAPRQSRPVGSNPSRRAVTMQAEVPFRTQTISVKSTSPRSVFESGRQRLGWPKRSKSMKTCAVKSPESPEVVQARKLARQRAREELQKQIAEANEAIAKLKTEQEKLAKREAYLSGKSRTVVKQITQPTTTPAVDKPAPQAVRQQEVVQKEAKLEAEPKVVELGEKMVAVDVAQGTDDPWSTAILETLDAHRDKKLVTIPAEVVGGCYLSCYFQVACSAIPQATDVKMVGAYNGWQYQAFDIPLERRPGAPSDFTWHHTRFKVPEMAYEISFVFTDGQKKYDNNNHKDFVFEVPGGPSPKEFEQLLGDLQKRQEWEEAARARVANRGGRAREEEKRRAEVIEGLRAEAEAAVKAQYAKARRSLDHAAPGMDGIWTIAPSPPVAGFPVKLTYRSSPYHLEWAQKVSVVAAVDGWSRGRNIGRQMAGAGRGVWEVELSVPEDALVLDFVFNDGEDHYDNNNDKDYHCLVDPHLSMEDRVERLLEKRLKEMEP